MDNDTSPETDGAESELITQFGSIFVSEILQDNTVVVGGSFFDITATPRRVADVLIDPPVTSDVCNGSTSTPIENPDIPVNDPVPISAGETITLSSQGNTYATLIREDFDLIVYLDENSLTGPPPAGLTVDIPGDEFPSFTNVSIPDVPALQITSPTPGEPITPVTQFSWTGSNTLNTFAYIDLRYTDTETGEVILVSCDVVDDGSFSFPAEIQTQINTDLPPDFASFTRATRDVLVTGNVALNVSNIISVDF